MKSIHMILMVQQAYVCIPTKYSPASPPRLTKPQEPSSVHKLPVPILSSQSPPSTSNQFHHGPNVLCDSSLTSTPLSSHKHAHCQSLIYQMPQISSTNQHNRRHSSMVRASDFCLTCPGSTINLVSQSTGVHLKVLGSSPSVVSHVLVA